MTFTKWFVEQSLTPTVLHEVNNVITFSHSCQELKSADKLIEFGFEYWLKQFFADSQSLQALLSAIAEKKAYKGILYTFATGIKTQWQVQTMPLADADKDNGAQITWMLDNVKEDLITSYWDLHIKMNEAAITLQNTVEERTLALERAEESEKKAHALARAIQHDKDFLNAILNNLTDGIVACDSDGKITVFNQSLQNILNLPEQMTSYDEWTNYFTLYEANSQVVLTKEQGPLNRALNGETLQQVEYIAVLKKQGIRNIIIDGQPLLDEDGTTVIGAVIAIHDITERNRIENRLIQSEKMAVVGRLATGIAHELNQPLTIIRANLQTLELLSNNELSKSDLLDLVSTSIRQVDRAAEIISRMRKFAIKMHKTSNAINIVEPIESALLTFEEPFRTSGIAIIRNFEANLPPLRIDHEQFEQVVCNLLSNAKYAVEKMKLKSPADYSMLIRLDLTFDKVNGQIMFDVTDNGIGMSEEILKHCLEPFFTAKEVGEGAGLGLTTVYNIVKLVNGQFDITSQTDKGTTVHMAFSVDNEQI
jgi:PAS domain S-box-containing protein